MEIWHYWVIAGLVFFIIEIFTSGFAVACFSFGAVAAAAAAAFGASFLWQIIWFSIVTALSFAFVRPLIIKTFYRGKGEKTNAEAVIGRKGRVSQAIDPVSGKGRVAIDGDDWKAVSFDGTPVPEGEVVEVVSRDSIILTVKKA